MTNSDTISGQPTGQHRTPELVIGDRYELVRPLGRGGMGEVWLTKDRSLGTEVALKFIPPEVAASKRAVRGLKEEAKLAMQLSHPNIVRLHNFEEIDEHKFLVMEYVDGASLEDVLEEREKVSVEELLKYAEGICAGLQHAHDKSVLHRDIKPANILITTDDTAKITDFGIAQEIRDSMTRLTGREVATSGTLPYMSPEQLLGEGLDTRSDVYSLGVTFYELLAGRPPFHSGDIRTQIQQKAPAPIDGVPDLVMNTILTALAKNPKHRFVSAKVLAHALSGEAIVSPSGGEDEKHPASAEENLARLEKTKLLREFVETRRGEWGHKAQRKFLNRLKREGFDPLPEVEVAKLLEQHKREYLEAKRAKSVKCNDRRPAQAGRGGKGEGSESSRIPQNRSEPPQRVKPSTSRGRRLWGRMERAEEAASRQSKEIKHLNVRLKELQANLLAARAGWFFSGIRSWYWSSRIKACGRAKGRVMKKAVLLGRRAQQLEAAVEAAEKR